MRIRISNGRVIDPGVRDETADVFVADGKIVSIRPPGKAAPDGFTPDKTIDAANRLVTPGLIDIHVHLREPGFEYKETIATGCRAAAAGGFTAVCPMPNTDPVNDSPEITLFIRERARAAGFARVYPVAAVSTGSRGEGLTEFGELRDAGAKAVSDDGLPVASALLMRRALEYADGFGLTVIAHCEEISLAANGAMNEGPEATRMGVPGIPNAVESIMVERDIALAELTGGRLHIAHVSTLESVRAIRAAKERGVPVTAETAPHYFTLTDAAVRDYDTNAKMNPPLRSEADRQAIRQGLADGTIDAIATDHAPHAEIEKAVAFENAPNGVIGLETALPLSLSLVSEGVLPLPDLIAKLTRRPAAVLGLPCGLVEGGDADIAVIDPEYRFVIDPDRFLSKSRNTPFAGRTVQGRAVATIVGGRVVYEAGD